MWSSKLKRRPSLTSIIEYLNSPDGLGLIESNLRDLDLTIPIPYYPRINTVSLDNSKQRWLRCLILTPSMVQPEEALQNTIEQLESFQLSNGGVNSVILFFLSPDIVGKQLDSNGVTRLSMQPTEADMMYRGIHALGVLTTNVKMLHSDSLNALNIQPFGAKEALPGLLSSCVRGILSGDLRNQSIKQNEKDIPLILPDSEALQHPTGIPSPAQQTGETPFPGSQAPPLPPNTTSEIGSSMPLQQQMATVPARTDIPAHPPLGLPLAQSGAGLQPLNALPRHMTQRAPGPLILKNRPLPRSNPLPITRQDMLPALPTWPGNLSTSRSTLSPTPVNPPRPAAPAIVSNDQESMQHGARRAVQVTVREILPGEVTQAEIGFGRPSQSHAVRPAMRPASHAYAPYSACPVSAVMDLLPYCTTQTKPLSRAEVIGLSDVAGSLREVVLLALRGGGGVENEEMGGLDGVLGPDRANGVMEFWGDEWVVD